MRIDRPGFGDIGQLAGHHIKRQAVAFHHHGPEGPPCCDIALIAIGAPDQMQAPGGVLKKPDDNATTLGPGGMRIAYVPRDMST